VRFDRLSHDASRIVTKRTHYIVSLDTYPGAMERCKACTPKRPLQATAGYKDSSGKLIQRHLQLPQLIIRALQSGENARPCMAGTSTRVQGQINHGVAKTLVDRRQGSQRQQGLLQAGGRSVGPSYTAYSAWVDHKNYIATGRTAPFHPCQKDQLVVATCNLTHCSAS